MYRNVFHEYAWYKEEYLVIVNLKLQYLKNLMDYKITFYFIYYLVTYYTIQGLKLMTFLNFQISLFAINVQSRDK